MNLLLALLLQLYIPDIGPSGASSNESGVCSGNNWVKEIVANSAPVCAQINYSNLAGTLPNPAVGTKGGVEAKTCSGSDKVSAIGTDGIPVCGTDLGGGSGAPTGATYIVQTGHVDLTAEQILADLATGIVKNTTTTGVLSIAVAGTDYEPAGTYSGIGACGANTWASTLNDTAAPTCTQPAFSNLSGTASDGQIAAGAVDGGNLGEIADGSITADDLGTDSVSADELNATGVETELEAVLDLPDLQGILTDGQIPAAIARDSEVTAAVTMALREAVTPTTRRRIILIN